jgi:hypothetical protein
MGGTFLARGFLARGSWRRTQPLHRPLRRYRRDADGRRDNPKAVARDHPGHHPAMTARRVICWPREPPCRHPGPRPISPAVRFSRDYCGHRRRRHRCLAGNGSARWRAVDQGNQPTAEATPSRPESCLSGHAVTAITPIAGMMLHCGEWTDGPAADLDCNAAISGSSASTRRPRRRAVGIDGGIRLRTISYFVGNCTGRSARRAARLKYRRSHVSWFT